MKKSKYIAHIFWVLSLIIMIFVFLARTGRIHFLPATINPYAITSLEDIKRADYYTRFSNCIGYIFLLISITMNIFILKVKKSVNRNDCVISRTNKLLKIFKLLFHLSVIIFTLIIVAVSLLITLFTFIDFSDIPM